MYAMLLTLSLAAGPQTAASPPAERNADRTSATAAPASLDGNWTIVCMEKNGQPVAEAKNMTVVAKVNTITCSGKDGKPAMTCKLEFAKDGAITVTSTEGDNGTPVTKPGVYVLTTDMLALCLHEGSETAPVPTGTAIAPITKSHCSIILKREGVSRTTENK